MKEQQEDQPTDEAVSFVRNLRGGNFKEALGEDVAKKLKQFILTKGKRAGRFLVAFPLEDGGHAFFSYNVAQGKEKKIQMPADQIYVFKEEEPIEEFLEEQKGLPIWWLEANRIN